VLTQNLTKQDELPFDLAHFQVEELEERLENKWGNSPCYERHTTTNLETGTDETVYLPTGNCN
jgi:hypothetical protein